MTVRNKRIVSSPKLMIIPMIDVIFFLLVFFMLSSLQMVEQKALAIQLPQAAAAQSTTASEPLAITLHADGQIRVEDQIVALDQLAAVVQKFLAQKERSTVILRADRAVEHGSVVTIMDILKQAGVQKLSIAAAGSKG